MFNTFSMEHWFIAIGGTTSRLNKQSAGFGSQGAAYAIGEELWSSGIWRRDCLNK